MPREDIMTDTNTSDADVVVNNTQTPVVNVQTNANTPASNIQTYVSNIENSIAVLVGTLDHTESIVGELNGFIPAKVVNTDNMKVGKPISDRLSVLDNSLADILTRVIAINTSLDNSLLK